MWLIVAQVGVVLIAVLIMAMLLLLLLAWSIAAPGYSINLLLSVSDAGTSDILHVANVTETTGHDASGVRLRGNSLVVAPKAYIRLAAGESVTLHYTYDVFDGTAYRPTTVDITIDGRNDAPMVSSAISSLTNKDARPASARAARLPTKSTTHRVNSAAAGFHS
jgi:VCBS repeat-containing protein